MTKVLMYSVRPDEMAAINAHAAANDMQIDTTTDLLDGTTVPKLRVTTASSSSNAHPSATTRFTQHWPAMASSSSVPGLRATTPSTCQRPMLPA